MFQNSNSETMTIKKFIIEPGWQIIFKDLGTNVSEVLTRAQLPTDLFSRQTTTVNSTAYFQFWIGLEATVKDPAFPLKLGQAIPVESFNPPLFLVYLIRLATREQIIPLKIQTQEKLNGGEISFLLGFDDPNSFFRAFHNWTGKTPEGFRRESKSEFHV